MRAQQFPGGLVRWIAMTGLVRVIAVAFLGVSLGTTVQSQNREDQWSAPADGLQARLWMMGPTPGDFTREKPFSVRFELRNAGEEPVTLPISANMGLPSLLAVTLHLTDPQGVVRDLDLGATVPEIPRPGSVQLEPGRTRTRSLDVATLTQSEHWSWWQGVGLPAGAYELAVTFRVERSAGPSGWRGGKLRTNTITFTVADGSVYPEYRPGGDAEILSRGPDGQPTHVVWRESGGVVRERLISDGTNGWPRHLLADIIRDAPGEAGPWTMMPEIIDHGSGAARRHLPHPVGHEPTALVRTWGLPVHSGAKRVYRARFVDGRLHGTFEGRNDQHIMSGRYVEGRRHGTWITRRREAILFKQEYRAGVLHGPLTGWHRNAALRREATYRDGALHGVERRWAPDGSPRFVGHWKNGRHDGRFESWYFDGTPRLVSNYTEGIETGTWRWHRPDGTLAAEGTWKHGAPWSGTFYWPNHSRAPRPAQITRYEGGKLVESWPDA